MAMAGFDMAAWDALAQAAGLRLAALLGAEPKRIPAYNSCGLGLMAPEKLADEAEKLLDGGFRAIKLRLGYPTLQEDLAALHAVKRRAAAIAVMVDYNQALGLAQALARGRALDREGIYWLEEPIRHDDYAGMRDAGARARNADPDRREFFRERGHGGRARRRRLPITSCPISSGSAASPAGSAPRHSPPRIGVAMSSHLFPEISVHLLSATPTCHFLEYVDWADKIVEEPLAIDDGCAVVPQRPGNGLSWDKRAVEKYRVA